MARFPGADAVYEVADLFRQRCLVESKSLLWPDEEAWTLENLNSFWDAFVQQPDTGTDSFITKWARQLSGQSDDVHRIAVDLAAIYGLFPGRESMGPASKEKLVMDVRNIQASLTHPEETTWNSLFAALQGGIGAPGQHYLTGRPFHMAFYLGFARTLKAQEVDPFNSAECTEIADEVKEEVKKATNHQPSLSRNILLHLLFPDEFERISSNTHKQSIFSTFTGIADLPSDVGIDAGLLLIREHLQASRGLCTFDFYDTGIKDLWDPQKDPAPPAPRSTKTVNEEPLSEIETDRAVDTLQTLLATTYLDEAFVREINDLLLDKKQLIFEGPPGSGKTYVAERFARWFTGQSLDAKAPLNEQVEIVQFHQSYGYEDFVQGIRPETNGAGQLTYSVKEGIFLAMCKRASATSEQPFVLIIDEINRGNLSRIFGELLLLLEYRGMTVRLPYGDNATLTIPENLYIIGTMNTADRSLAQIDYALRRRFYFVRFMPVENRNADVFESWLNHQDRITATDRSRLLSMFVDLNEGISAKLNSADLQVGHSYFMTDTIETDAGLNRVWTRAVAPLLNEYLHHHRDRDEIIAALTPASLARQAANSVMVEEAPIDGPATDAEPDANDPAQ